MDSVELALEPTYVPEWEAEDLVAADLASDSSDATAEEARAIFGQVTFQLPLDVSNQDLVGYAAARETPLGDLGPDTALFDFHLMELPLNILIPEDLKLVRLKVSLQATAAGENGRAVAYDLFPHDAWDDKVHDIGEVSLDVSKLLTFVCPAPLTDVLGLKLSLPLRWRSRYVRIRTSDRMCNPLEWYVTDVDITQGFTGYAIWRVPKGKALTVDARVIGELRSTGPFGRFVKARFHSNTRAYALRAGVTG